MSCYPPYSPWTVIYNAENHPLALLQGGKLYRHYNPRDGRWINRDSLGEEETVNLYRFVKNNICLWFDYLGNGAQPSSGGPASGNGVLSTYTPSPASENYPQTASQRNSSPKDSTSFLLGMSQGTALPPSAV